MRLIICGGPRSGKTTHAKRLSASPRHCDDLIGKLEWSEQSAEVARWFSEPGPWVIEGVSAVRALRKFLDTRKGIAPADLVVYLDEPRVPLTPRQAKMRADCMKAWREVQPKLAALKCRTAERAAAEAALALLPAAR